MVMTCFPFLSPISLFDDILQLFSPQAFFLLFCAAATCSPFFNKIKVCKPAKKESASFQEAYIGEVLLAMTVELESNMKWGGISTKEINIRKCQFTTVVSNLYRYWEHHVYCIYELLKLDALLIH